MATLIKPPALGIPAPDFALPATDGRTCRLGDVSGANGTVVVFICNHCPYVQAVAERMVADAKTMAADGIGFVAISSNDPLTYPADSFDRMGPFAARYGFPFPYLFDESQDVARAYDAVCTPDFFGFNRALQLQYRGRLDASRTTPVAGARRDLFEAMVEVARTGQGPKDQIASMGCSIKWRKS